MAAEVFDLQRLITVTANTKQDPKQSIDVGPYKIVIIRVKRAVAGTGSATLQFEDALYQDEADFDVISGATVSLVGTGVIQIVITNPKRFLRWTLINFGGSPQFSIDGIAREN